MRSTIIVTLLLCAGFLSGHSQPMIEQINLEEIPSNSRQQYWLKMIDNGLSQPICVPVIILKGHTPGPVLGLAAAIHGNELNGIPVIQQVVQDIDLHQLQGTIIAIPGLNAISLPLHQRTYIDEADLNRLFPGKKTGNRAQQYVWAINQKILSQLDYLVDLHTASFGRENCLYVRADLQDDRIAQMAYWQDTDIILSSTGEASVNSSSSSRTMRAEAMLQDIPTITIELGNPQVYQEELIARGVIGVQNIIHGLKMIEAPIQEAPRPIFCKKSYWLYIDQGGYLEIPVALKQQLQKGEVIGILKDPFGTVIKTYYCPEDGIVIGKSSNPVNMSGGRIIHLGIIDHDRD